MLTALVLNSDATLNNFETFDSVAFIPGEQITIALRLFDDIKQLRYVPPSTAVITLKFNKTDGTSFTKTTSYIDVGDRSMISVTLQETETEDILGGSVSFDIDVAGDGSNIKKGYINNMLSKTIIGDC